MTEVLTISSSPNGSFISRPLTRNASQTTLLLPKHAYSHPNVRQSAYSHDHNSFDLRGSASISSSAPSSPVVEYQDSEHLDYHSTPSSSLSLDEDYCSQEEDDIQFPTYSDQSSTSMSKLPSLKLDTTSALERSSDPLPPDDLSAITSAPVISNTLQSAGDDTAVTTHPSRHVDYLSHEWAEEDIWSSWRHIVARRATLKDAQRLENAAWRTWAKSQNGLKTVSAEKLNWMKDHDVTWLYGPLQQSQISSTSDTPSQPSQGLQRTNSFNKKPILKKRSVSEMMLQKSLSNLNLIQRAVDAVKAQGPVRPALGRRAISDYRGSDPPSVPPESPSPLVTSSFSSPGVQTPNGERRHIHFNEKVDQCIAVEEDDHDDYFSAIKNDDSDDDSDDGIIMMKTDTEKERKLNSRKGTPRTSFSAETNKTIAILPSTTLKYRGDTPEPAPAGSPVWSADKRLTVSSSQETLKPTDPSSNFLLDYDEEMDTSWQPSSASSSSSTSSRKKSIYPRGGIPISAEDEDEEMETRGLRRTPSGMFMPYEEDEDDMVSAGLFGKVVDTVNTARDIAHVIWNVGWRK